MKRINLFKSAALGLLTAITFSTQAQVYEDMNFDADYTIVDLNTGQAIDVYYDPVTFKTMNRATNMPVDYYIIQSNNVTDTVHGITGLVVNGMLIDEEGKYKLDNGKVKWENDELKIKMDDGRMVKWEEGKLKMKHFKNNPGEKKKMKDEWGKVKWKDDKMKVKKDDDSK